MEIRGGCHGSGEGEGACGYDQSEHHGASPFLAWKVSKKLSACDDSKKRSESCRVSGNVIRGN